MIYFIYISISKLTSSGGFYVYFPCFRSQLIDTFVYFRYARADVKIRNSNARTLSQTIKAAINIKIDGAARKMKITRISIKMYAYNGPVQRKNNTVSSIILCCRRQKRKNTRDRSTRKLTRELILSSESEEMPRKPERPWGVPILINTTRQTERTRLNHVILAMYWSR